MRFFQLVVCLLLCATGVAAGQETVPELTLKQLSGESARLAELSGKVVVLNFWATWCVPCVQEMPMLQRIQADYAGRRVVVVGASADGEDTLARVTPFVARHGIRFPVWLGATTADMQRFGLGTALPATAIIDQHGRIAGRILGPLEEADLRYRIEWLLGNRKGPPPAPLVNNIERALREHEEETGHRHGAISLEAASSVPS